ncbi:MAG TPA: PqqD family protein [Polyangia bacterium]|nr:PqqD family protein [Polyangia bacterium]
MAALDDILRSRPAVAVQKTPEGAIAVDMATGRCWELNQVGAAFWARLDGSTALREIADSIGRSFNVSADVVERDLLDLADRLASAGLVERATR